MEADLAHSTTAQVATIGDIYQPTQEELDILQRLKRELQEDLIVRNRGYLQFNNRPLVQYINDSDKRLNTYVCPASSYDPPKEEWQSNVPLPILRDKQEKLLAGFSMNVPDANIIVSGKKSGLYNVNKAYVAEQLIKGSYLQEENSIIENFWESWELASHGTVIKYEGYLKTKYKQKIITSYDPTKGKIEYVEKDVVVDDKPISYLVPLTEIYISNPWIVNIQDQPHFFWVRYVDYDTFMMEYGDRPNAHHVIHGRQSMVTDTNTAYDQKQNDLRMRPVTKIVELIKYYNKSRDEYIVYANNIVIDILPLLWRVNGVKVYPFAKTIFMPFADAFFFYGRSFADKMAGIYDAANTTFNTLSDKQYRSMIPGMIIGKVNQDAFELEDEILSGSTRYYVSDVNQVKPNPVPKIDQSDILYLQEIFKIIEDSVPSLTSMVANKNMTARQTVLVNENIQQSKNVYSTFMEDLWRQKYQLRFANIQTYYPLPVETYEKDDKGNIKEKVEYRTYTIDNTVLDEVTGERGTLAIQFRDFKNEKELNKSKEETSVEEAAMKKQGINYRKLVVPSDYFDNAITKINVVPGSLFKESIGIQQAEVTEEINGMMAMFPRIYAANQDELFGEYCRSYNDSPDKYLTNYKNIQEAQQKAQLQAQAQTQAAPAAAQPLQGQQQAQPIASQV